MLTVGVIASLVLLVGVVALNVSGNSESGQGFFSSYKLNDSYVSKDVGSNLKSFSTQGTGMGSSIVVELNNEDKESSLNALKNEMSDYLTDFVDVYDERGWVIHDTSYNCQEGEVTIDFKNYLLNMKTSAEDMLEIVNSWENVDDIDSMSTLNVSATFANEIIEEVDTKCVPWYMKYKAFPQMNDSTADNYQEALNSISDLYDILEDEM